MKINQLKKVIAFIVIIMMISLSFYYYKGLPMQVFSKYQTSHDEFQDLVKQNKSKYQDFKQKKFKSNTQKLTMNFNNLHPPKNSYISIYSSALSGLIYMESYSKQIELTIPSSYFFEESGQFNTSERDRLMFQIYSPDTTTIYRLEQEKSNVFWQQGKDVNIHFLPREKYYDEDRLPISYEIELIDRKENE